MVSSLANDDFNAQYTQSNPEQYNKFSFRPAAVGSGYLEWPKIADLGDMQPVNGLMEKRGGALIDIDRAELVVRMMQYYDKGIDWKTYQLLGTPLGKDAARFDAEKARKQVLTKDAFDATRVVRYFLRPFDIRYAYYTPVRPIWNEPRPQLWTQYDGGNLFLISRPARVADPEGVPFIMTKCLGDNDAIRGHAYYFPLWKHDDAAGMLAHSSSANLGKRSREYLTALGYENPNKNAASAEVIWFHALAIGFSSLYREENKAGLTIDWPRIPLPVSRDVLDKSAGRGRRLSLLLDTEANAEGISGGNVVEPYRTVGVISASALEVTSGWGREDKKGSVYPGIGKVIARDWSAAEKAALMSGFGLSNISASRGFELLGRAIDVYLNDHTHWRAVPEAVWELHIGGYQVLKKWLSYRELTILGRPLNKDEAREVTSIIRRLTAIILMTDELDDNYASIRDSQTFVWKTDVSAVLA